MSSYIYKYIRVYVIRTCIKDVLNKVLFYGIFSSRTARRHGTPWTSPTRTKLAENLWNTFERLRATWISVELRSLLVPRHDPSTFPKIGIDIKIATIPIFETFKLEKVSRTKKFHCFSTFATTTQHNIH